MILGIEDKSKYNIAFSVDSIVAVTPDESNPEFCLLYLAHVGGMALKVHFTVSEFMTNIGKALEAMQGRASLLGMAGSRKQ